MKYYDYRGHKDIAFIYYNEWADPKIEYRGFQWSAWEVEDALEYDYNEVKNDVSESLQDYIKDHVKDLLTEWLYALDEIDIDYIYKYSPQNFHYLKDSLFYSEEWDLHRMPTDTETKEFYTGVTFVPDDF